MSWWNLLNIWTCNRNNKKITCPQNNFRHAPTSSNCAPPWSLNTCISGPNTHHDCATNLVLLVAVSTSLTWANSPNFRRSMGLVQSIQQQCPKLPRQLQRAVVLMKMLCRAICIFSLACTTYQKVKRGECLECGECCGNVGVTRLP